MTVDETPDGLTTSGSLSPTDHLRNALAADIVGLSFAFRVPPPTRPDLFAWWLRWLR